MFRGVVRAGCANLIELFVVLPVQLVVLVGVGVVFVLAGWIEQSSVGLALVCVLI